MGRWAAHHVRGHRSLGGLSIEIGDLLLAPPIPRSIAFEIREGNWDCSQGSDAPHTGDHPERRRW